MSRVSRERYREIFEASPDAILLVDEEGVVTHANERVTDLFGYESDELVGESVDRLVPEASRAGHVTQRDAYVDDPEVRPMGRNLQLEGVHKDGSTVPVAISLSPLESDGDVEVMAAIRDVSEQRTLRKKYQTILETVPDPVVVADAETGEIVEINDRATELLGYDAADLVGRTQLALHPSEDGDRYRRLFDEHVAATQAIFRQLPDGSDVLLETAGGERIPVEINAQVFELEDRQLITGVFRDVSQRKKHERQLKALHETTRDLMAADSREEVAHLVATVAATTLGYASSVVRLVGESGTLEPVAVTDQARADMGTRPTYSTDGDSPVARAYERDEPVYVENVTELDDGFDRAEIRSAMYLPMDEHGVVSIANSEVDAFERADVELASVLVRNAVTALDRLASERELERQNERLDEFASLASHDLRNPLSTAMGWVDLVNEEQQDERLDRVQDALDRMNDIIDDTLTLARQGRQVVDPGVVDVSSLADDCWEMVATGDAQLHLADEFRLRGDESRLRHVFENLFRNAVEFGSATPTSEDGAVGSDGTDATVTIGLVDDRGFYVEDDGPGIPEDERETVFETGYSTAAEGTGLGLSIVRRIAQAHGWDVRVTEGRDGGARFEFTNVALV